jgi:hypothetical protein
MVNYPYFKLRLKEPENAPPLFINCSALPPGLVDYIILWLIMAAWIMYIVMSALLSA